MHAGLVISLWAVFVAALQFLPPGVLAAAVFACGVAALSRARARSLRLLRRVRFLVLAIFVLFAGFTPGEAILPAVTAISPSREGMKLAMEHAARLLGVVLCVALLLETLSVGRLVGGLHALLRPLDRFGLPTERLAVRMMLVLHYVESAQPGDWRRWLDENEGGRDDGAAIVFAREHFGAREMGVLLALIAATAIWLGIPA